MIQLATTLRATLSLPLFWILCNVATLDSAQTQVRARPMQSPAHFVPYGFGVDA